MVSVIVISTTFVLVMCFDRCMYLVRNDMDAIPRSVSTTGLDDHAGSRKRLMFIRREISRVYGDEKMRTAVDAIPKVNTKRSNLITNVAVENN